MSTLSEPKTRRLDGGKTSHVWRWCVYTDAALSSLCFSQKEINKIKKKKNSKKTIIKREPKMKTFFKHQASLWWSIISFVFKCFLFVFHRRRYTHKNSHTHTEVYANLLLNYHYIYTLSYNIIYLMLLLLLLLLLLFQTGCSLLLLAAGEPLSLSAKRVSSGT